MPICDNELTQLDRIYAFHLLHRPTQEERERLINEWNRARQMPLPFDDEDE